MKKKILIVLLLLLAFLIRVPGINYPLYMDECNWPHQIRTYQYFSTSEEVPHPPLTLVVYKFTSDILGLKLWVFRLTPLIFAMASIFLVYIISKRNYSTNAAFFSVALIGISFWHVLSSLMVDMDGSILTYF